MTVCFLPSERPRSTDNEGVCAIFRVSHARSCYDAIRKVVPLGERPKGFLGVSTWLEDWQRPDTFQVCVRFDSAETAKQWLGAFEVKR